MDWRSQSRTVRGMVAYHDDAYILTSADREPEVISGTKLTSIFDRTKQPPRLVVLAACQSTGAGAGEVIGASDRGELVTLGPRLAEAGIAAVVALQDDISLATVTRFMPTLFRELAKDGQIDRAMAAARAAVMDRGDYWVPVLFTRLVEGRLWSTPGFARREDRLLADHAGTAHILGVTGGVGDDPVPADQLHRLVPFVRDADGVPEYPVRLKRARMLR